MRYLDVCAGISASTVAWKPLGWEAVAYSEIEAAPRAILAHHYPETPLHGDFTTIKGDEYGAIDLLVGGTPCQAFSVAGLRKGLDDERGNLTLEYLRLADRARPRWLVWENVPGVLSIDGGRTFGTFLRGMGELGYGFAYRVLDAQHFGVPQRRRRVFVVGYLGDHRRAAAVLFERHSVSGHPAPSREAGKGLAGRTPASLAFGGGNRSGSLDVAACLVAKGQKCDFEVETFIADLAGTLPAGGNRTGGDRPPGMGQETADTMLVATAFTQNSRSEVRHIGGDGQIVGALAADAGAQQQNYVAFAPDVTSTLVGRSSRGGGQTNSPGHNADQAVVATASAVRRLTPRECERLQGFSDDYTLVPYRKGMMADGPRYKALGNSMAVPVMRWIGERIAMVDALQLQKEIAA